MSRRTLTRASLPAIAVAVAIAVAGYASAVPFSDGTTTFEADVNGDRVKDDGSVTRDDAAVGTLAVSIAGGGVVTRTFQGDPSAEPAVVRTRNVDGRRGAEMLVHTQHISTNETYLFFSYRKGKLTRSRAFSAYGHDDEYRFGFRCKSVESGRYVYQHFLQKATGGNWKRTVTEFKWYKGKPVSTGKETVKVMSWTKAKSSVGIFC